MRYLRRVWSGIKWHALVPPMAIIAVGLILGGNRTAAAYAFVLTLVGAMLNLLFKGAQLRAYFAYADELGVAIDIRTIVAAP